MQELTNKHLINWIFIGNCLFLSVFASNILAQDSVPQKIEIKDYPLPEKCYYPRKDDYKIEFVVIHFCSDVVYNPSNPYRVERIYEIFSEYKVSSHYLIDREGNIYQFVKEEFAAKHASYGKIPNKPYLDNAMNHYSIGIELMAIGAKDEMAMYFPNYFEESFSKVKEEDIGFTEAQYQSLDILLQDIYKRYPDLQVNRKHIIGHSEYRKKSRTDPGRLFDWEKIGLSKESAY